MTNPAEHTTADPASTYAQDILDTVREPLLVMDAELRVRSANGAFYRTFRVAPEQTENRLIWELGSGQWDIPALRTLLESIIAEHAVFNDYAVEHTFPGIGRRSMRLNARRLRTGTHGAMVVLAIEDITERLRFEQSLAASERYAQDIVDTVRKPLLILDSALRVESANRAFYSTFQTTPEETETRCVFDLGGGAWEVPGLRVLLQDIIPADTVFNDFEMDHEFPRIGRRVLLLNARKLQAGDHRELLLLALEDVTERRHAEEEVALARETAETASRAKSLFLANMSHELRTPLNAILGYSEMLQEEAVEKGLDEFVDDLVSINTSGRHLLALINDILDLSKIEAGKMDLFLEDFDVAELIREVALSLRPLVEKNGNRLEMALAEGLGSMHADQVKVRQGLFNLLSNAVKFTADGTISVDAGRTRMDRREWIEFRVTDTGIGLGGDQIVKLFQDFTQADASTTRKFGGTGLGLALTRRFCLMMGGDVTVQSEPGVGSTFTIKLPAIVTEPEGDDAVRAAAADVAALSPGGRRRGDGGARPEGDEGCVLVIDDNPMQRDLMHRYLAREGFHVRAADGGEEGLRLARQLRPAVITLDVVMPGMDGWSVLSELKNDPALRDIPVIILTMVDDPERGFTLGAADYVPKPLDRQRLARILKKHACPTPPCPVLVVDDDAVTRAMMRNILERQGRAVTEAENGKAALSAMEHERPSLILLDLMMPEMDGFEFAQAVRLRPEWRSIPIVVVTAHDVSAAERRRLDGFVQTILTKEGDSRESLLEQVRDLLDDYGTPRAAAAAMTEPIGERGG